MARKLFKGFKMGKKSDVWALIPIGVFLILYLGLGILFEYVLGVSMGFYNIPIILIFVIAIAVACLQTEDADQSEKFSIMGKAAGNPDIMAMLLIFILAGAFVGIVGRESAESVAYFILSIIPPQFAVAVLLIVSFLVSLAMGTSVGTITLITPIACAVSKASGFDLPICIGAVVGGAMFGDNLSLISDTTIAACNGQGVPLNAKFKENFKIALPAALATLVLTIVFSVGKYTGGAVINEYDLIKIIPYIIVFICGVAGLNVYLVLSLGILSGAGIMIATGSAGFMDILSNAGSGISGMFETCMVAVLVAALCGLVFHNGGAKALINGINKVFKGHAGGQLGIGCLVGAMDIATANNTVAIVMANPIAKEISSQRGIKPEKTASLLDTFSCILQGLLPYGAQMLVAVSACAELKLEINAFQILPYMFYPYLLLISSLIFIVLSKKNKKDIEG